MGDTVVTLVAVQSPAESVVNFFPVVQSCTAKYPFQGLFTYQLVRVQGLIPVIKILKGGVLATGTGDTI
jgi:hypothetical protein